MLDIRTYRAAEATGRAALPSWRDLATHQCGTFESVGFPVRVETLAELGLLLDTMQEGRADIYRAEMGELPEAARVMLSQALVDQGRFAAQWQARRTKPATDTLTAMLCVYSKLEAAAPGFRRVLEIGPGCGYLSFFLAQCPWIDRYVQIEACESFYLLQHFVNAWAFDDRAEDLALGSRAAGSLPVCTHIPWWLARCAEDGPSYDIATANACLLEMHPNALAQYLTIAANSLKPGSPFVAQCFGHWQHGNKDTLVDAFAAHGFKARSIDGPEEGKRLTWNGVWERQ